MPDVMSVPIAVIGLACRYPGARTPLELWENVLARRRQFRRMPARRLALEDYYDADPKAADKTYTRMGAFIDGFEFDWARRRIPQSTFRSTDIVHWLALETAIDAFEDAGFGLSAIPGERTAVIVGNSLTGEQTRANTMRLRWPFVRRALAVAARRRGIDPQQAAELEHTLEIYYKSVFPPADEDTLAGGLSNTIAGRICNYIDLFGGGYTVDGACASSLLAIATAARSLSSREADLALAGGVDISLDPFELVGFAKAGALTGDDMRVYDHRGNGFFAGEGCGFVVLKRLADARRDKNSVYAVLNGWGISSDGGQVAITAPSAAGQARAIRRAYRQTAYNLQDLDFIEGHGTATAVGDRVEIEAVSRAMRQTGSSPKPSEKPCGMTSLKSIVGHTKAASGVGGFIKTVMALNRRVMPPTAGCRVPHPAFAESDRKLYPVLTGQTYSASKTLRAGVSAMGFGGINCHVTLESADTPDAGIEPTLSERSLMASFQETEIFVLQADSVPEMLRKVDRLRHTSSGVSMAELTDLAAHLGREATAPRDIRAAIVAGHPEALDDRLTRLHTLLQKSPPTSGSVGFDAANDIWVGNRARKLRFGVLFPGQGSQQLNMARMLVERFAWARDWLRTTDELATTFGDGAVGPLVYPPAALLPGSRETQRCFEALSRTEHAQPAICLASLLWYRFLRQLGLKPAAVGGHSLGELTAFYAAGALSGARLLKLAAIRGHALAAEPDTAGAMLSLNCGPAHAKAIIQQVTGYAIVANINAPRQVVLSGERTALLKAAELAAKEDIRTHWLPVSNAFHSRMADPAARCLAGLTDLPQVLPELKMRLYTTAGGHVLHAGSPLRQHFADQVTAPVDFVAMIRKMARQCDLLLEIGPGRVLSGLVGQITGSKGPLCLPVESSSLNDHDLNLVLAALFAHGAQVRWEVLYRQRLVRDFIPPSRRKFIENPCEQPFADLPESLERINAPLTDKMEKLVSQTAGLPAEQVAAYLEKRGEFLAAVIRADIQHPPPGGTAVLAAPVAPGDGRGHTAASDQAMPDKSSDAAALYRLIEDITGFPRETLTPDARLLDDLNLDSIKSADLIAKFARQQGLAGLLDPAALANATLRDILDAAVDRRAGNAADQRPRIPEPDEVLSAILEQASQPASPESAAIGPEALPGRDLHWEANDLIRLLRAVCQKFNIDGCVDVDPLLDRSFSQIAAILVRLLLQQQQAAAVPDTPLRHHPWVREFKVDMQAEGPPPLPSWWGRRREDRWADARVLILCAQSGDPVAVALYRQLMDMHAVPELVSNKTARERNLTADPAFSHVIAVLPKDAPPHDSQRAYLRSIVERLAGILNPPPASRAPRRRTTLAYVQFGGGFFGNCQEDTDLCGCGATAAARSVHQERGDLRIRVLDFSRRLSAESVAEHTLREMQTPDAYTAVGFDAAGTRRVPVPQLLQPSAYRSRPLRWSTDDVVLVTGGAKGITAACALELARATGVRMALMGRSSHARDGSPGDRQITATLERYAELKREARYYCCDVCDRQALAATLARIRREMGPIRAVIHGAGLNIPRPASQVPAEDALHEVSPKVLGALNLAAELHAAPPRIFVGLTSVIGITGMPGNAWYAFSNEALDLILRRFSAEHSDCRTQSVAYSIWRDEGMGARMGSVGALQQQGIDAIPTEEGVKRFVRLFLHDPGDHQVMVTARLGRLHMQRDGLQPPSANRRYLEQALHVTAGVESAFRAHLTLEKDPYVRDHCFQGSYLFPAVFGIEAMAQAVAHASGATDFQRVRIENLRFQRPITVDPQNGADIVVWAQLQEKQVDSPLQLVKAGVYKTGTGTLADFFTATFILGRTDRAPELGMALPERPLDIRPVPDLYRNTLLFQGPRFQRIEKIWRLDDDRAYFTTTRLPGPETATAAFTENSGNGLLLGDAFFRDSLLQSAALLIPQDTSLPVSIKRLDIFPCADRNTGSGSVSLRAIVQRLHKSGDQTRFSVTAAGEDGGVCEKISGYVLKIMEHHNDYPTVADLVRPDERDSRMIRERLDVYRRELGIDVPETTLCHMPDLHTLDCRARHRRERPILENIIRRAVDGRTAAAAEVAITWRDSGKPVVEGAPQVDVSISHDSRFCLFTAGRAPQGCDIAPVSARSRDQWRALLGDKRAALLEGLSKEDGTLDRNGTRLWTALEAFAKSGSTVPERLQIIRQTGDAVLFQAEGPEHLQQVLTFPLRLTRGKERMLAFSVPPVQHKTLQNQEQSIVDYPGYEDLFDRRHFKIIEGGPQGQGIFIYRLPATFLPAAQLSRSIYFSHYLFWAGTAREASTWPILRRIASQVSSGKWGGVTNFTDLKILGEATTADMIEVWLWASGNGGPKDSVLDITFDFRKVLPDGGYQRLAWLDQQATWVRVLDHGAVKVEAYPEYYRKFLDDMLPRYAAPNRLEALSEPLAELSTCDNDALLYDAPEGPVVQPLLCEHSVETSLQNANVVGNIYFANYSAWQGLVRDRYFHRLAPEYFRGTGEGGELLCLRCRVDHLREAMPFDRIAITMALKSLHRCHATFYFEYFQENPEGPRLKLATGRQDVVWIKRDGHRKPTPAPFPARVQAAFEKAIRDGGGAFDFPAQLFEKQVRR